MERERENFKMKEGSTPQSRLDFAFPFSKGIFVPYEHEFIIALLIHA